MLGVFGLFLRLRRRDFLEGEGLHPRRHDDDRDEGQVDRRQPPAQLGGRDRQDGRPRHSFAPSEPSRRDPVALRPEPPGCPPGGFFVDVESAHGGGSQIFLRDAWHRPGIWSGVRPAAVAGGEMIEENHAMAINAQELQGQWNRLKGQVKEKVGQLHRRRPPDLRRQRRPARREDPAEDRRRPRPRSRSSSTI